MSEISEESIEQEATVQDPIQQPSPEQSNDDPIAELKAEKAAIQEELLRSVAAFQNYKKRAQQEAIVIRQYANESLVSSLLPVLDNFERTVKASETGATLESTIQGVKAVEKQFRFLLEQQGVQRMTVVGQPFDALKHEAIATVQTDDFPADTIIDEVEPGYMILERVVRPAKVRIAVAP